MSAHFIIDDLQERNFLISDFPIGLDERDAIAEKQISRRRRAFHDVMNERFDHLRQGPLAAREVDELSHVACGDGFDTVLHGGGARADEIENDSCFILRETSVGAGDGGEKAKMRADGLAQFFVRAELCSGLDGAHVREKIVRRLVNDSIHVDDADDPICPERPESLAFVAPGGNIIIIGLDDGDAPAREVSIGGAVFDGECQAAFVAWSWLGDFFILFRAYAWRKMPYYGRRGKFFPEKPTQSRYQSHEYLALPDVAFAWSRLGVWAARGSATPGYNLPCATRLDKSGETGGGE